MQNIYYTNVIIITMRFDNQLQDSIVVRIAHLPLVRCCDRPGDRGTHRFATVQAPVHRGGSTVRAVQPSGRFRPSGRVVAGVGKRGPEPSVGRGQSPGAAAHRAGSRRKPSGRSESRLHETFSRVPRALPARRPRSPRWIRCRSGASRRVSPDRSRRRRAAPSYCTRRQDRHTGLATCRTWVGSEIHPDLRQDGRAHRGWAAVHRKAAERRRAWPSCRSIGVHRRRPTNRRGNLAC